MQETESNEVSIENLTHLIRRSEKGFKCDYKKHAEMFSSVNIFSAFKSPTDYMIVEYGQGYAIFVDGEIKKSEVNESKSDENLRISNPPKSIKIQFSIKI